MGKTVQLGILPGDEGGIIGQVERRAAGRICVEMGLRFGLYNNAPGKLLHAFQTGKEPKRVLGGLRQGRFTVRRTTTKEALRRECECVVERGYSTDWGEAAEALKRAALRARDVAIQTNTGILVMIDGKMVTTTAEESRAERDKGGAPAENSVHEPPEASSGWAFVSWKRTDLV